MKMLLLIVALVSFAVAIVICVFDVVGFVAVFVGCVSDCLWTIY